MDLVVLLLYYCCRRHLITFGNTQYTTIIHSKAKQYIGLNKNILILPLSDGADPEFWQVTSDMEFKTTDGYLGFVPSFVINSPITVQVSSDMPGPNFVNNFLGFLKANDITEIVYTPAGLPQTIKVVKIINTLGWTTFNAGGATIIKVPLQYQ